MKRVLSGISVFALLFMAGCSLVETPKSKFSEEEAYKSSTLVYLNTVASVYNSTGNYLNGNCRQSVAALEELSGDGFFFPGRQGDWVDGGQWQNLFLHTFDQTNAFYKTVWNNLFTLIGLCNTSIDKLATLVDINEDAAVYMYEIRAYRAVLYYYLMDLFAEVPIVKSSSTTMTDVKQSHRSEVFTFVTEELEECLPHLSEAQSQHQGEYYGRITKGIAYMCLCKCAMNAPIYVVDNTSETSYQFLVGGDLSGEARATEEIGDDITERGKGISLIVDGVSRNAWETVIYCVNQLEALGYSLSATYAENFSTTNDNSNENIFVVPNDENTYRISINDGTMTKHYSHGSAIGARGNNGLCATTSLMIAYHYGEEDQETVRLKNNLYCGYDYTVETGGVVYDSDGVELFYKPLEARIDFDNSYPTYIYRQAGARVRKYEYDKSLATQTNPNWDIVIWRFGDAYLMRGEAQYRLGDMVSALAAINRIRERAEVSPRESVTLDVFNQERRCEFAWEGLRRTDMIRYGIFTEPTVDRYKGVPHNASANDWVEDTKGYTNVFPIPYDALSLNTNLKQNPGYAK